jgi:PAS domain S-box-containing protein
MPEPDLDQEKIKQELRIQRQIGFVAGLFQEDVTTRTLLESLAEGCVIIDTTGTILLINGCAEQMFGYAKQDLLGKHYSLLVPERLRKESEKYETHYFEAPKNMLMGEILGLVGLRQDASEFPLEMSLGFIETTHGILILALISDITLRRHAETARQQSEELFHIQLECVKDYAIYMLDSQGNVLNWNAGAERLKGYRAEEVVGKHVSLFYSEEDKKAGKPVSSLQLAADTGRVEEEDWRIRKDGSRFWGELVITALRDEDGKLWGFSQVTHDISERKRADDALRLSEARYRTLYDNNPVMIITVDQELAVHSTNPTCTSQLGYTLDELKGQPVLKLFLEGDRPAVTEHLRVCFQNPSQVYHWQFRKIRKDGVILWVEETAQAVYGVDCNLCVLIVCQDISDRKQAEESFRDSEARFHAIFDVAAVGIAQIGVEGNWLLMNQKLSDILGYSFDELRQMTLQQISHPDDMEPHLANIRRLLAGEVSSYTMEKRYICKDGSILWVNLNETLVRDRNGEPEYFIAIVEDINERKKTQEALRDSLERFRLLADSAPVIIWETDPEAGLTFLNRAGVEYTGRKLEQELGQGWTEGVHPDDIDRCLDTYLSACKKRESFSMEYRLRRNDGEYGWLAETGVPRLAPNGDLLGCFRPETPFF